MGCRLWGLTEWDTTEATSQQQPGWSEGSNALKAHFTLAQMARFHFSKCLNHHPIIYSKPFFIDLSINGHFGCFCDLTVVNNAAVEEYIYLFVFFFLIGI